MDFDAAFTKLIGHEGGFTADQRDRGNWTTGIIGQGELRGTKYGIAAHAYPKLDIENLTLEDAKRIYRADYWGPAGCDSLPGPLRAPVFDIAVNSGPTMAIRLLQRAVGVKEDGVLGSVTIGAVNRMEPTRILARLQGHRLARLAELPSWPAFGRGWARRIADYLLEA